MYRKKESRLSLALWTPDFVLGGGGGGGGKFNLWCKCVEMLWTSRYVVRMWTLLESYSNGKRDAQQDKCFCCKMYPGSSSYYKYCRCHWDIGFMDHKCWHWQKKATVSMVMVMVY
jgi:hypothetical protein